MISLVGYTGFVGSNLATQVKFDGLFNSSNITSAYGTKPELLVYSGVRAEKFLANKEPEKDLLVVKEAFENIKKINPAKLVLISTVDIYKTPVNVDENSTVELEGLHPYGLNRYYLEEWIRNEFPHSLIVRLPALFGQSIKKNFIYDFIHVIPAMLTAQKLGELGEKSTVLNDYYKIQPNGFYKCIDLLDIEREKLKKVFLDIGFSAVNFTDSRSVFQYYNLNYLWSHIQMALLNGITTVNLAVEPLLTADLYNFLTGKKYENSLNAVPVNYNMKTVYANVFGGSNGYIFKKEQVMNEIKALIEKNV
jgi:hypothetical protein